MSRDVRQEHEDALIERVRQQWPEASESDLNMVRLLDRHTSPQKIEAVRRKLREWHSCNFPSLLIPSEDDRAVLVWRNGKYFDSEIPRHAGWDLCYATKEDAMAARKITDLYPGTDDEIEPFRVALEDWLARAKRRGANGVRIVDSQLRTVDEYRV